MLSNILRREWSQVAVPLLLTAAVAGVALAIAFN
jgi:hypothetical protein